MDLPYQETTTQDHSLWLIAAVSAIRAIFGVIWAINAYLTWLPSFATRYVGYLHNAAQGQPTWLQPWFTFWINLVEPNASLFIWLTRIIETVIAIGLLLGLGRKWIYILGFVFSLLIWSTAEGFSGPYVSGVSNLGSALVYVIVFIALIIFNRIVGKTPYSLDYYIEKVIPAWSYIAEWAPPRLWRERLPRLPWMAQSAAIAGLLLAFVIFFGSLQSALSAPPATPSNAASAVSPLSLAQNGPIPAARDAALPPLLNNGNTADVTITATDTTIQIANGVSYQAWTFDGTVPGPILHLKQGQKVNVTFVNKGNMQHSIDFHAAQVAPSSDYVNVDPGKTLQFSFTADVPGAYLYHCGTAPVLMHIGNGMYGAVIVDPDQGMPAADVSYVLVQGEWYTLQVQGNTMAGDFNKMKTVNPDEVVFNGAAFQYRDHPLTAKVGQTVRLYVVDAGPNLGSAFHVIGAIFKAVYPDGDPTHAQTGVSSYEIAPGQGVVFDVTFAQPGNYPFVDHSMRSAFLGAVGVIDVSP